ncbi:hypothetical protein [Candidatus Trichorickettsia mobilis]|nr:hypothetical protein [Candidatus Trichorickettsia mobilis]
MNPHVIQEDAASIMGFSRLSVLKSYEVDAIENKITAYNNSQAPFIQEQPFVNLNFCIKDDNGVIIAGITSVMYCTLLKKIH